MQYGDPDARRGGSAVRRGAPALWVAGGYRLYLSTRPPRSPDLDRASHGRAHGGKGRAHVGAQTWLLAGREYRLSQAKGHDAAGPGRPFVTQEHRRQPDPQLSSGTTDRSAGTADRQCAGVDRRHPWPRRRARAGHCRRWPPAPRRKPASNRSRDGGASDAPRARVRSTARASAHAWPIGRPPMRRVRRSPRSWPRHVAPTLSAWT